MGMDKPTAQETVMIPTMQDTVVTQRSVTSMTMIVIRSSMITQFVVVQMGRPRWTLEHSLGLHRYKTKQPAMSVLPTCP